MKPLFIAIEGIDGAGKGTTTRNVRTILEAQGLTVSTLSFPNYGKTRAAQSIEEMLNGSFTPSSPYHIATLFSLDRAETLAVSPIEGFDVFICDRYTASNAAFQMARLPPPARDDFLSWLFDYEYNRLNLPRPDLQILLKIDPETASLLVLQKGQRSYTDSEKDLFEGDASYQDEVSRAYEQVPRHPLAGAWKVVTVGAGRDLRSPHDIAKDVADLVLARLSQTDA